jgi:glutamate 5-kinase
VAKGIVSVGADELRSMAGQRSADLDGGSGAVVHADDLVVLPG